MFSDEYKITWCKPLDIRCTQPKSLESAQPLVASDYIPLFWNEDSDREASWIVAATTRDETRREENKISAEKAYDAASTLCTWSRVDGRYEVGNRSENRTPEITPGWALNELVSSAAVCVVGPVMKVTAQSGGSRYFILSV